MKRLTIVPLVVGITLFSANYVSAQQTPIGVQFGGRSNASGNPPVNQLNSQDVAGALPQAVWNFINNSYDFTPANNGETFGLVDTNSTTTPITLTFNASDSWYDDVDPASITNVNAILC